MKKVKISVIIPVRNGEKNLPFCLKSVLNQSYKNYEVVVVDNNSEDNTKKIIEDFRKKDGRIKYVFEKKIGRGAARNAGIKKVKGEIIVMTDSDCIVPENWIKELTKEIIEKKEQATVGFEENFGDNYWTRNIQKNNFYIAKKYLSGGYITFVDTKNFAIESSLLKKLMFDDTLEYGEDYELSLRMRKKIKVKFMPEIRVRHFHKNSFSERSRLQFKRGYWSYKIHKKHRGTMNLENELILRDFNFKKNLISPFLFIKMFIGKPVKDWPFLAVSAISWKAGSLWGIIKK